MIITMTKPTHDAWRFRMPVGTFARTGVVCADVEAYVKGTTVFADGFADGGASSTNRPRTLAIPGIRSWSPPV